MDFHFHYIIEAKRDQNQLQTFKANSYRTQ